MGCCCKKKKSSSQISPLIRDKGAPSSHDIKYSITDFHKICVLGRGTFGKVLLVRKIKTNTMYAMKILQKEKITKWNQEEHTKTERSLLEQIKHPFIVQLHYAFQDANQWYFVTDFAQGGELFFHWRRESFFSNDRAKFYVAQWFLAWSHLHSQNFIYRDLKPENILLDNKGYLKLTDFGWSKTIKNNKKHKAYTICGTPQYLAPEILLGEGYDNSVDWWSWGVWLYEMLSGKFPFHIPKSTPLNIENYLKPVQMCNNFTQEARDWISKLLVIEPKKRWGYGVKGDLKIKNHLFFEGLNWESLEKREIPPEFIPETSNETDVRYFDKQFTSENVEYDSMDMNNPGPSERKMSNNLNNTQDSKAKNQDCVTMEMGSYEGFTYVNKEVLDMGETSFNSRNSNQKQ